MKPTTLDMLRRWMAIDRDLHRGRLLLSEFADIWMVDRKTLRRDLRAFRKLGYPAVLVTHRPGRLYYWKYPRGQQPMFAKNLRP
jgi:hypothetical protein